MELSKEEMNLENLYASTGNYDGAMIGDLLLFQPNSNINHEQSVRLTRKIVHRCNCHPDLLAALEEIRTEEEYRRKLCNTSDLRSQPIPKSIIENIAIKAIAKAEK